MSVQEDNFSWNLFPIIFLGGRVCEILSSSDYFEKLLSNEHSFIIFVMKLCDKRETLSTLFCCILSIGENYFR